MMEDAALRNLMVRIVSADDPAVLEELSASPSTATSVLQQGATRATAAAHFLKHIGHHFYTGDTALHVAAAAYRPAICRALLDLGADVAARNRRGATPLHYARDGNPQSPRWSPSRQSSTITLLVAAGADPNAVDKDGVTPLHRAVRNRCAAAVGALLDARADGSRVNANGSTPLMLAMHHTGRGGSDSPAAKAEQARIVELLGR